MFNKDVMKKFSMLIYIFLSCASFSSPIQDHTIDPTALSDLASALGIPQDANIIEETQKKWLRKPNQERWEMTELSSDQKKIVLNWAKKQGHFSAWTPIYKIYDKAFILGGTVPRMQMRLDFLKILWEEGVRFNEIIWLTGDRPLDNRIDGLLSLCRNESEAAKIIWDKASLPNDMHNLYVTFIPVPMKTESSSHTRPNREDTIIAWLKTNPGPCKALFVSEQPFCGHQFSILKKVLPKDIEFEMVGPGVDSLDDYPAVAAITLDSIARWIYEEEKVSKKQGE